MLLRTSASILYRSCYPPILLVKIISVFLSKTAILNTRLTVNTTIAKRLHFFYNVIFHFAPLAKCQIRKKRNNQQFFYFLLGHIHFDPLYSIPQCHILSNYIIQNGAPPVKRENTKFIIIITHRIPHIPPHHHSTTPPPHTPVYRITAHTHHSTTPPPQHLDSTTI